MLRDGQGRIVRGNCLVAYGVASDLNFDAETNYPETMQMLDLGTEDPHDVHLYFYKP